MIIDVFNIQLPMVFIEIKLILLTQIEYQMLYHILKMVLIGKVLAFHQQNMTTKDLKRITGQLLCLF